MYIYTCVHIRYNIVIYMPNEKRYDKQINFIYYFSINFLFIIKVIYVICAVRKTGHKISI